jgi:hypothetical protein
METDDRLNTAFRLVLIEEFARRDPPLCQTFHLPLSTRFRLLRFSEIDERLLLTVREFVPSFGGHADHFPRGFGRSLVRVAECLEKIYVRHPRRFGHQGLVERF